MWPNEFALMMTEVLQGFGTGDKVVAMIAMMSLVFYFAVVILLPSAIIAKIIGKFY